MNRQILELKDKHYAIIGEPGGMKIATTDKSSSKEEVEDILKLEDTIEELYKRLIFYNQKIKECKFKIKEQKWICGITAILIGIAPFFMMDMELIASIKEFFVNYTVCSSIVAIPVGLCLTLSAFGNAVYTHKSIKNQKKTYEESKKNY